MLKLPGLIERVLTVSVFAFVVGGGGALYFYADSPYIAALFAILLMSAVIPGVSQSYRVAGALTGAGFIFFDLLGRVIVFRGALAGGLILGVVVALIGSVYYISPRYVKRRRVREWNERLFPIRVDEADEWRVRAIYGVLLVCISAVLLVTIAHWIEYKYLDQYNLADTIFFIETSVVSGIYLIFLYHLAMRGRWRWSLWGINLLTVVSLFLITANVSTINDTLSLAIVPVMLSAIVEGWQTGLLYGVIIFALYSWRVEPGGGSFNYFVVISLAAAGALAYFLTLKLRQTLRREQQSNHELRMAFQEMEETRRTLSLVILGVSHEIRTPLTAIAGGVTMIKRLVKDNRLALIMDSMDNGLKRLRDLAVEMNRLTEGSEGLGLDLQPANLLAVVNRAVRAEEAKLYGFDINVPEDIAVEADPAALQQVLQYLIENTYLHADGRPKISAEVENEQIVITVADDGPGIEADELPYVFVPFMRGDAAIGKEGRGMGLTMTRLLAEAHGGTIQIESEAGKGCRVFVRLPLAKNNQNQQE